MVDPKMVEEGMKAAAAANAMEEIEDPRVDDPRVDEAAGVITNPFGAAQVIRTFAYIVMRDYDGRLEVSRSEWEDDVSGAQGFDFNFDHPDEDTVVVTSKLMQLDGEEDEDAAE